METERAKNLLDLNIYAGFFLRKPKISHLDIFTHIIRLYCIFMSDIHAAFHMQLHNRRLLILKRKAIVCMAVCACTHAIGYVLVQIRKKIKH